MNIPIYRAKKLDTCEYVEGFLTYEVHEGHRKYFITRRPTAVNEVFTSYDRIDPSSLSISFNDMLDKNNKRIFASLSEDGKGGDTYTSEDLLLFVWIYKNGKIRLDNPIAGYDDFMDVGYQTEVTGIYEGE